jgi:hypothetical protein
MFQDALVVIPRSSLSLHSIVLSTKRVGIWSTGQWGKSCGELIKTGHFDRDFLVEKPEFYNALGEEEYQELHEELKNLLDLQNMDAASQKSTSNAQKSNNINRPCPDAFKSLYFAN